MSIEGNSGVVGAGEGVGDVDDCVTVKSTCVVLEVVKSVAVNLYSPLGKSGTVTLKFMFPLASAGVVPRSVPFMEASTWPLGVNPEHET